MEHDPYAAVRDEIVGKYGEDAMAAVEAEELADNYNFPDAEDGVLQYLWIEPQVPRAVAAHADPDDLPRAAWYGGETVRGVPVSEHLSGYDHDGPMLAHATLATLTDDPDYNALIGYDGADFTRTDAAAVDGIVIDLQAGIDVVEREGRGRMDSDLDDPVTEYWDPLRAADRVLAADAAVDRDLDVVIDDGLWGFFPDDISRVVKQETLRHVTRFADHRSFRDREHLVRWADRNDHAIVTHSPDTKGRADRMNVPAETGDVVADAYDDLLDRL